MNILLLYKNQFIPYCNCPVSTVHTFCFGRKTDIRKYTMSDFFDSTFANTIRWAKVRYKYLLRPEFN